MSARATLRALCLILVNSAGLYTTDSLSFEPNRGQTAAEIRYLARTSNGVIFVTDRGVTLSGAARTAPAFQLVGAASPAEWTVQDPTGETISYYVGRDASKWVRNAPRFARLIRPGAYPGIDLVLYGTSDRIEYDFLLAPHADPAQIRLKIEGARRLTIDPDGNLVADTSDGELRHHRPVLTETLADGSQRAVTGAFRILARDEVGFSVEGHNPAQPLSIDPVIESATYFGGSGDDSVVATDGNGNMVGTTTSIDLPGASFLRRGGTDVFAVIGQQTFVIGGSGNETVTSAFFDFPVYGPPTTPDAVVIGGYTDSTDLPTGQPFYSYVSNPVWQSEYGGGATDGFLIILSPSQTFAGFTSTTTYVGGPGADRVNAVAYRGSTVSLAGETDGGLPIPSYAPDMFETTPAGGLDGFLMIGVFSGQNVPMTLYSTNYLGGSGDDRILGLATDGFDFFVTGVTNSPNFPLAHPLFHSLKGETHGFVAKIGGYGSTLTASTLFGGSGSDRGTAITILPDGNLAVGGVTSSTDLPLLKATQKTYGGGASDGFLAQFAPDLSKLIASTYIGGSEADEVTSITAAYPNTIFVGGWTESSNFPVVNAIQPTYGGGSSDGFLVHFNDDGSIYEATYYGGSGADQVLGVTATPQTGSTVWLAGSTTSPNLPLANATQSELSGSCDGFIAELSANLINAGSFVGGKDLRAQVSFPFGHTSQANAPSFTITSSNSAVVQLAVDAISPGQDSITFFPKQATVAAFYLDCLSDSGGANLTITAFDYVSRTVPVTCYPQAVSVYSAANTSGAVQTHVGAGQPPQFEFYLSPNAINAFTQFEGPFAPIPGAAPITVQVATSNPSIGAVAPASMTLSSNPVITFTPSAIGTTELTFQAGDIAVLPASLPVIVTGSYNPPATLSVAAGFDAPLFLYNQSVGASPVTVTSENPSRLVVSLDPSKKGGKSVQFPQPYGSAIWVQGLAAGSDVPLTISVPGEPDVTTMVHFTSPVVALQYSNGIEQALQLSVGGSSAVGFAIYTADQVGGNSLLPNPGSAVTFTLQTSTANIVSISPASAQLTDKNSFPKFQVTGTAPGSTVLSLTNSANIAVSSLSHSVPVQVKKTSAAVSNVEVGKDLVGQGAIALSGPAVADTSVTLSIADPTKALLSPDTTSPGLSSITAIIGRGGTSLNFYVYGLVAAGQTKVTASMAGQNIASGTVSLDAAGFYWSADSSSVSVGNTQSGSFSILVGPLDASSMLPVNSQSLRPEFTGTLGITSSNPGVVSVVGSPIPIASTSFQFNANSGGSATLTLVQPAGFGTPSVRQKLTMSVAAPQITLSVATLAKNTQTLLHFSGVVGNPPVTVTSSDPSRVLLSNDPAVLGKSTLTTSNYQIYLQTLKDNGKVTITVSAANNGRGAAAYNLVPTGLGITFDTTAYNSGVSYQNGKYTTTTQSNAINVQVGIYIPGPQLGWLPFIPGLNPLSAQITSSNTAAAVITGSPVTINPKQQNLGSPLATATLLQVGPGETTISISQPSGFSSTGYDKLTLDVTAPALAVSNFGVAKDTLSGFSVALPSGMKTQSVSIPVTITSSDPSRILLSPDGTSSPTASVTVSIAAGATNATYYVYALSNNGTVSMRATAPGFADTPFSGQLFPLGFGLSIYQTGPINAIARSTPQQLTVAAGPVVPQGASYNGVGSLRPGIPPVKVGVISSDPTVVSVSPQQLVFQGNTIQRVITYTPLKPGRATVSLQVPASYATLPNQGQLSIVVSEPQLSFNGTINQLGKDLETSIYIQAQATQTNTTLTATSSDPSRLVLSTDPTIAGTASVTMPVPGYGTLSSLYLQGLASSENATIKLTANGYQTATMSVALTPSGAVFTNNFNAEQNLLTTAGVKQYPVLVSALDPVSLVPMANQYPRPGVNLSVTVYSSNPGVIAVTSSLVQLTQPPQPTSSANAGSIGIQPVAAGTATVTLGTLAGNPSPSSGNKLAFNVTEAPLSIAPVTLGVDLETPVQLKLGSSVPLPTSNLSIPVSGGYPIALALHAGDVGQNSIVATIPAGQRLSTPFYVQATSTGSGSLNYGGGQFPNLSTPVTVSQTAFVIKEAQGGQSLNLNVGATSNLTIIPALSPPSSAASAPLSIRAGANPITIAVASTVPSVVSVSPAQVTLNPGDQHATVSVQGASAGSATVKLLGTVYDFSQPQSSIQVVVK